MKLTTNTQVFVDGVMQANGGRNEKLDPGVERGGWARPLFDDEAMTFVNEVYQRADAFLFGRRTYELFAGYWGVQFETTGRCVVRRRVRDERATSAIYGGSVQARDETVPVRGRLPAHN